MNMQIVSYNSKINLKIVIKLQSFTQIISCSRKLQSDKMSMYLKVNKGNNKHYENKTHKNIAVHQRNQSQFSTSQ